MSGRRQGDRPTVAVGTVLDVCLRFLDGAAQEGLLAATRLVEAVAAIPESVSDPSVAVVKLKWWRDALNEAATNGHHQHPLIHDALAAGLFQQWNPRPWGEGILALGLRCDASPFTSQSEFLDWCAASTGLLESAFLGAGSGHDARGMRHAVLERLQSWRSAGGTPAWLPLDLVAGQAGDATAAQDGGVTVLANAVLEHRPPTAGAVSDPLDMAYALRDAVISRRLAQLANPSAKSPGLPGRPTLSETWFTWRTARRLAAKLEP